MTYTHLTMNEVTMIHLYWSRDTKVSVVMDALRRSKQTIYKVYHFFETGKSPLDYCDQSRLNKARCGRKPIYLPAEQADYIKCCITKGWTPDTIIGRHERDISCSTRTLYCMFTRGEFDVSSLPMKGKRHPNDYIERRGKVSHVGRSIHTRLKDYPAYNQEFGHLEGDTIIGKQHHEAIMTLVERQSKMLITLNVHERSASNIETQTINWSKQLPKHLFKSITFDNGKEFSNWKQIANEADVDIYFSDVGAPNQRGLNENCNGLLRKDGLKKSLDLENLPDSLVQKITARRNYIPRKSLNYKTPIEVFMTYITDEQLMNLA